MQEFDPRLGPFRRFENRQAEYGRDVANVRPEPFGGKSGEYRFVDDGRHWPLVRQCRSLSGIFLASRRGNPFAVDTGRQLGRPEAHGFIRRLYKLQRKCKECSARCNSTGENTMRIRQRIAVCLWFDDQAEAAAAFYTSIFRN
jgi:hypothetical protein